MEASETVGSADAPQVLDHWTARKVQPVVLLYVVLVFVGFMALAIFFFHSLEAVTALVMAGVAAVVATVPGVLERVEYRATGSGIDKRSVRKQEPADYQTLLLWDELDHVVPLKHGFKFYKPLGDVGPLRRFWRAHVIDAYSGEVHVERTDLGRVMALVERQLSGSS